MSDTQLKIILKQKIVKNIVVSQEKKIIQPILRMEKFRKNNKFPEDNFFSPSFQ